MTNNLKVKSKKKWRSYAAVFPLYATTLRFSSVLASAEPFGPEPFGRELRVERLTADGLDAGC